MKKPKSLPWKVNAAAHRGDYTLDSDCNRVVVARFPKREDAHYANQAVNAFEALVKACDTASFQIHHGACNGRRDGRRCDCFVGLCRAAVKLALKRNP